MEAIQKPFALYSSIFALLCFLSAVFVTPSASQAATFYVTKTGSDSNSCAQAMIPSTSKETINAGISCLSAGDTLIVKAGTYSENLLNPFSRTGTTWTNKITVKAESPRAVIIKSTGGDGTIWFNYSSQKYIEFDGVVIDASASGIGVAIWGAANHIRFQNSAVLNAVRQGVSILKDGGASPDFNEFVNVEVAYSAMNQDGTTKSCHQGNGYCHGFYINGDYNLLDRVNLHHNNGYGVQFYPYDNRNNTIRNSVSHSNWAGIASMGDSNRIINTLLYNNPNGALIIASNNNLIYNNTIYNNPGGWGGMSWDGPISGTVVKNNIFYKNSVNGGSIDSTNLVNVNPLFVNASAGNFHLQASSPAIDAGTTLPEVTTDVDGTARPQGTRYDIGASEFMGGDTIAPNPPMKVTVN